MLGGALAPKPRASKRDATDMIRSLGFSLGRNAEPQPVGSEVVKLIKRGPKYSRLTRHFSGVSGAIDEALVTLENGGYITLPADYTRPDVDWGGLGTVTDIETRGVPEYMAMLLARNDTPTRKKSMRKFWHGGIN